MKKINEKELKDVFEGIKNGDKIAFEKLYNDYNKLVYGIAFSLLKNKHDAEDVVQMVFTKLYAIDRNKLPTKSEASWLYSVTKNETLGYMKSKRNNVELESIYEIENDSDEIGKIIDKDSFNRIISNLNENEKEIISLKIVSNLSFEEISKMLNIPEGTVKWRYYKSVYTLKILLGNLAMFVVTFVSGVLVSKNGEKSNTQIEQENSIKSDMIIEDVEFKNYYDTILSEKEENTIREDNSSQTIENVVVDNSQINNQNYLALGLIGTSAIFLILTIGFLTAYIKQKWTKRRSLCP